ncbi:hypothetical protein D9M68_438000 [compost metagenome]
MRLDDKKVVESLYRFYICHEINGPDVPSVYADATPPVIAELSKQMESRINPGSVCIVIINFSGLDFKAASSTDIFAAMAVTSATINVIGKIQEFFAGASQGKYTCRFLRCHCSRRKRSQKKERYQKFWRNK